MWILEILLCCVVAALIGYGCGKLFKADREISAAEGRKPLFPKSEKQQTSTGGLADPDPELPARRQETGKRHWTEFLDNSSEANDRSDDWEWDRQDDFGDPWDHPDSWGG